MTAVDTHSFRVAVYRKHASYNAKFESAKAELREILTDNQLDSTWLSMPAKDLVSIFTRARDGGIYKDQVPDSLWDNLIGRGILLSRFEESNLKSELLGKIDLAENSGLQTLKGLTLPTQIGDISYLNDSESYLRCVDHSIDNSSKEKARHDYFPKAYGVMPKIFFASLVRGTNFELNSTFIENDQTYFHLKIIDSNGKTVITNNVSFNLEKKIMTVLETDSGHEWHNKGAGKILVRNLLEAARLVGMEKVVLGGGGTNGGRFWASFGAEISDVKMRFDSDMHGSDTGRPYYGLQDSVEGIKTWYGFFSQSYGNNAEIKNVLERYNDRVANLNLSNVNELVWDLASERASIFSSSQDQTQFGRFFFQETKLRFNYEFKLEDTDCWKRIYKYCAYGDKIR